MGQVYSYLGYENTAEDNYHKAILCENFSCILCLEVLTDPVQCQQNEHYFCRACITKQLEKFKKCPLCSDQLTLETLRPAPRIVASVVSQLKKARCGDASRGCTENVQMFVFGGGKGNNEIGKSIEIFNWSTKTWTIVRNCLFYNRMRPFSFVNGKKILVCGGKERIEYLNPSESGCSVTLTSISLPSSATYGVSGLLYKDRILTFGQGVVETSLESPGKSKTLLHGKQCRSSCATVHCIDNNIYIVGGAEFSMEKYDVVKNEIKTLPSLPYSPTVSNMATVAYKDNIILIGGKRGIATWKQDYSEAVNDVVMFNVIKQEYKKLPSMLENRSGCTAVNIENMIVVMGGENKDEDDRRWKSLKTVEYYVIGDSAWQELPVMHLARVDATACVYKRT